MRFDGRWDNIAPVILAQYKGGQWHYEPATPMNQKQARAATRP
jgi:hypothetical protein